MPVTAKVIDSFADSKNLKVQAAFPVIDTVASNSEKAFRIPITITINNEAIPKNISLQYSQVKLKIFVAPDEDLVANDWIFKVILNQNDTPGDWGEAKLAAVFDFEGKVLDKNNELKVNVWIRRRQAGNAQQVKGHVSFFPSLSYVKTETLTDNATGSDAGAGTNSNRFTVLTSDRPPPPGS